MGLPPNLLAERGERYVARPAELGCGAVVPLTTTCAICYSIGTRASVVFWFLLLHFRQHSLAEQVQLPRIWIGDADD